jgi:NAD(P)-dependent dehydrogenase (short-subunit alcohol dehydrogenase family)
MEIMSERERITLITGAARGIGRTCAERLASNGHTIVGLDQREPTGQFPGDLYHVDLNDRTATEALLSKLAGRYAFNGLLNNAGIANHHAIEEYPLDVLDEDIQVIMTAAIQCVKALAPLMKAEGFGRIVSISSELVLGHVGRTGYAATKAALISLARTWSLELTPHGVTVNCIAPGPIDTEFFQSRNPPGSAQRKSKLTKIPAGRIGRPNDIANAVEFFMREESEWITGQTLFVDGGSSIGGSAVF